MVDIFTSVSLLIINIINNNDILYLFKSTAYLWLQLSVSFSPGGNISLNGKHNATRTKNVCASEFQLFHYREIIVTIIASFFCAKSTEKLLGNRLKAISWISIRFSKSHRIYRDGKSKSGMNELKIHVRNRSRKRYGTVKPKKQLFQKRIFSTSSNCYKIKNESNKNCGTSTIDLP